MGWVLSSKAIEDLSAILEHIEDESGSRRVASKVLDDFEKAFHDLADMPNVGRVRDELTGPNIRWWRVHSYLVVYDPDASPLRIIRVIHGARHLSAMFHHD